MSIREISLVVGTAGHIDHGKTQLVKAMTGVDCDRLNEEKKRGITIELGFAPLELPSERVISLIDVPGHERFIRQMVSGASGVDAVLLVVAADEGVMPQTREHLDILSLLGIEHGVIALTKTDLVDSSMIELVTEDVMTLTAGTFLESAPIVPVSAFTGDGIEDLKRILDKLVDVVKPRSREGAFFMPIDRTFPVAGFGTVVTGTAYKGVISAGDNVDVIPLGQTSRVRSVQVHGKSVETAFAGQRVAICLSDIELNDITRGDVVCSLNVYKQTNCVDAMLKLLPHTSDPLVQWQRVRLHVGTSDVLARVSLLEDNELRPGCSAPVQLVLEKPIAASLRQRFIVRSYSPMQTIGGGEILVPYASRPAGKKLRLIERERILKLNTAVQRSEKIAAIVSFHGRLTFDQLMLLAQEREVDLSAQLEKLQNEKQLYYFAVGQRFVYSVHEYEFLTRKLLTALSNYHNKHISQKGVPLDELINQTFVQDERKIARVVCERLITEKQVKMIDGFVALQDFQPEIDNDQSSSRQKILKACLDLKWELPLISDIAQKVTLDQHTFRQVIEHMKNNDEVIIIDGKFLLAGSLLNALVDELKKYKEGFTLAQVRDLTGSSRKYVLPVLEYLDGRGITRRAGDKRIILSK